MITNPPQQCVNSQSCPTYVGEATPSNGWNCCGCPDFSYLNVGCTSPNGCQRESIRTYVDCQLEREIGPRLLNEWQAGDILAVGDSLTSFARAVKFDPMLPRTFNAGVPSARISDITNTLQQAYAFLPAQGKVFNPSKIIVLAGTNDLMVDREGYMNQFRLVVQNDYHDLFDYLSQLRNEFGCQIIIRSIPPGTPQSSDCYISDQNSFMFAVSQANFFLQVQSQVYNFTFVNYGSIFLDSANNTMDDDYTSGWDQLHWGCLGYQLALGLLVPGVYAALPQQSGNLSILPPQPSAPLQSTTTVPAYNVFRYVHYNVPPAGTVSLTVSGSGYNYAGIFDPSYPGGLARFEDASTIGAQAQVYFTNQNAGFAWPIVLCMGCGWPIANYNVV